MMEEGEDRIRATYGENYDRLVKIKTSYDPDKFLSREPKYQAGKRLREAVSFPYRCFLKTFAQRRAGGVIATCRGRHRRAALTPSTNKFPEAEFDKAWD